VPEFFTTHQYLSLDLVLLLAAIGALIAVPGQRKLLLLGGLLCLPFAFTSYDFIPEYWNPVLIYHNITSPEDILFSVSSGLLATFCAILPVHWRLAWRGRWFTAAVRYLGWGLLGWCTAQFVALVWLEPNQVMYATFVGLAVAMIPLALIRRELAWILAQGAGMFTLLYVGVFLLARLVFPDFAASWTAAAQLPYNLSWLPAFEVLWGLAFGYCWPLFIFHVLDLKLLEPLAERK
jgi:hypothetical protein